MTSQPYTLLFGFVSGRWQEYRLHVNTDCAACQMIAAIRRGCLAMPEYTSDVVSIQAFKPGPRLPSARVAYATIHDCRECDCCGEWYTLAQSLAQADICPACWRDQCDEHDAWENANQYSGEIPDTVTRNNRGN